MCVCVCVCVYVCVCVSMHMCTLRTVSFTKMCFPGSSVVKNPSANAGATGKVGSIPGSGRSSGGGNGHQYSTPVFFPGKSHGERSLGGYSLWGCKELDKTKHACTLKHE